MKFLNFLDIFAEWPLKFQNKENFLNTFWVKHFK